MQKLETAHDLLIKNIRKNGLEAREQEILELATPAILVKTKRVRSEKKLEVGASKFGGSPDVPATFQWPEYQGKPLTFIAQLRLRDVAPHDPLQQLPSAGMLYFFYEADERPTGHWAAHRGSSRVFYVADKTTPLQRLKHLVAEGTFGQIAALPPCSMSFSPILSLPSDRQLEARGFSRWERDNFLELEEYWLERFGGQAGSQLLGNQYEFAGDGREECQLAYNGVDAVFSGYLGPAFGQPAKTEAKAKQDEAILAPRKALLEHVDDWQLLFQLITDQQGIPDMELDNCPVLCYFIRKEALKARDFDQIWAVVPAI